MRTHSSIPSAASRTLIPRSLGWSFGGLFLGILLASSLRAVLPPGAAVAPNCGSATALAFPKKITACGVNFGAWDSGTVSPLFGRTGFYATTTVSGSNGASLGAFMEFDSSGNATRKISPIQFGTTIRPTDDANIIFASQQLTGSTDITFGLYNASTFAPVYQNKLAVNVAKTSVGNGSGREVIVTQDLNTQIEVSVFNPNGSLKWGQRLSSASFGGTAPTTQTVFPLPLEDGSMLLAILKSGFSITPPSATFDGFLVKLSAAGSVEWAKRISTPGFVAYAFLSGNFMYLGLTTYDLSNPFSPTAGFALVKMTTGGSMVWSRRIISPAGTAMYLSGIATGDRPVLGSVGTTTAGNASGLVAVMGGGGTIDAKTQFSFGSYNVVNPIVEGDRIWLSTLSSNTANGPYVDTGAAHIGRTTAALGAIQWKRYKNNVNSSLVNLDYDGDDVVASYYITADRSIEAVSFKDDFVINTPCSLFTDVTVTTSDPVITAVDAGVALNEFVVTPASFAPAVLAGSLTFETLTTAETSLCGGGGPTLTPPAISPSTPSVTVGGSITLTASTSAASPTWQWKFNGQNIAGATNASYTLSAAQKSQQGIYSVVLSSGGLTAESSVNLAVNDPANITFTTHPQSQLIAAGSFATLSAGLSNPGALAVTYQWRLNGVDITSASNPTAVTQTLVIAAMTPATVGLYTLAATAGGNTVVSNAALLSITTTSRITGSAEFPPGGENIQHINGNVYDQFLLTGTSATVTADPGQVGRISYIDLNDDIVQVEFSGAGFLTLSLASSSGPALPVNYIQSVNYMKGRATIVFSGVDGNSHLSSFSVGRANAVNQGLFKDSVTYDALADIAQVVITGVAGQFGGFRGGNISFSATSGFTGLYAPGMTFAGPITIHDINAQGTAAPKLLTSLVGTGEVVITGGDLLQTNGQPIEFGNAQVVRMSAGTNSHGVLLPAKANQGQLVRNGVNVTTLVITGP